MKLVIDVPDGLEPDVLASKKTEYEADLQRVAQLVGPNADRDDEGGWQKALQQAAGLWEHRQDLPDWQALRNSSSSRIGEIRSL